MGCNDGKNPSLAAQAEGVDSIQQPDCTCSHISLNGRDYSVLGPISSAAGRSCLVLLQYISYSSTRLIRCLAPDE